MAVVFVAYSGIMQDVHIYYRPQISCTANVQTHFEASLILLSGQLDELDLHLCEEMVIHNLNAQYVAEPLSFLYKLKHLKCL
jgi:hypothetical protein